MKILCPNCNQVIKLSDLESRGVQSEYCSKCKTTVYATYVAYEGSGRKVWDLHFEKPPDPKKKQPKQRDGCVALMLLFFVALAALILISFWRDLNIIHINGP
jgi:hypothetical protein